MKNGLLGVGLLGIVAACSAEPATDTEQVSDIVKAAEGTQDKVKTRQISIEEAAEEATKIIEADAKAEIDSSGVSTKGL
jgi:hypothetical protein